MIFDIIVFVVLLISALHAFWRGFIREVLTIFGAIGGIFAAITFGNTVRPTMDGWLGIVDGEKVEKLFDMVPMTIVSAALSYGLVFILVFGVLSFISHMIAEQVRALGLGAVDRTLGVVFGLLRGLLILGIFYLPVHIVMDQANKDKWFKDARTYIYIEGVAKWLESVLPENLLPLREEDNAKDSEGADNGARGVLQQLDVLKNDGSKKPDDATPNPGSTTPATDAPKDQGTGYGEKQRETLDHLIEKGIDAGVQKITQ